MNYVNLALILIAVLQFVILMLIRSARKSQEEDYIEVSQELTRLDIRAREVFKRVLNLEHSVIPKPKRGRPKKNRDGDK